MRQFVQRRFVRDTAILQGGQFAMIVIQALTNFLLIRILGKEQLGVYTLIVALAGLAAVLDISGSTRLALTHLAKATGAGDAQEMQDVIAYFIRINLQFNLPLVILFSLAAPIIGQALYHNPEIGAFARWLVFTELTDVPTQLVGMVLQTGGKIRTLFYYETSKLLVTSLVMVIALLAGWGIPGLITGTLLVNLIYSVISVVFYQRLTHGDARLQRWPALLRYMISVKMRDRFRQGFSIAVNKNLGTLTDQALILFLGTLGPIFMGNFSVAMRIVTLPQPLISGLARSLDASLPRRAGMQSDALDGLFTRTTVYSGAIWAVATLAMAVGGPILLLVFFPDYSEALPFIFPLLFQSLSVGLGVSLGPTLRTAGKVGSSVIVQIVFLALLVPVGLLSVSLAGPYGAVWFAGLQDLAQTVATIALVRWVLRNRVTAPA